MSYILSDDEIDRVYPLFLDTMHNLRVGWHHTTAEVLYKNASPWLFRHTLRIRNNEYKQRQKEIYSCKV